MNESGASSLRCTRYRLDAIAWASTDRSLTAVVERKYTTGTVGGLRCCHGFCPPQREFVLPGAQCAPRRKSAATASCAAWGARADYGRGSSRGFKEASLRGAELARSAGTDEQSSGSGRCQLTGDPKARIQPASAQPRTGGPLSAAP